MHVFGIHSTISEASPGHSSLSAPSFSHSRRRIRVPPVASPSHAVSSTQAVHDGHVPSVQGSVRSDSQSVAHAGQVRVQVLVNSPVEASHSHAPQTNAGTTHSVVVSAVVVGIVVAIVVETVDAVVEAVDAVVEAVDAVVDLVVDSVVDLVVDSVVDSVVDAVVDFVVTTVDAVDAVVVTVGVVTVTV